MHVDAPNLPKMSHLFNFEAHITEKLDSWPPILYLISIIVEDICKRTEKIILSEFLHVFQHFNSIGMYDIVYDTGTSLAVQVLAFENVNLKTWSRYLERLDEEYRTFRNLRKNRWQSEVHSTSLRRLYTLTSLTG